eukprot:SAG25_NODE_825_length_5177_cov_3.055337_9_plen_89_part_00
MWNPPWARASRRGGPAAAARAGLILQLKTEDLIMDAGGSHWSSLQTTQGDPITTLAAEFKADTHPDKVGLSQVCHRIRMRPMPIPAEE